MLVLLQIVSDEPVEIPEEVVFLLVGHNQPRPDLLGKDVIGDFVQTFVDVFKVFQWFQRERVHGREDQVFVQNVSDIWLVSLSVSEYKIVSMYFFSMINGKGIIWRK